MLLDAAMAGPDARDRRSLCGDARPWPQSKARIHYIPRFGDAPVDGEVAAATARVAAALAREGHAVREEGVDFDLDDVVRIWHVVSRAGVAWLMGWREEVPQQYGRRLCPAQWSQKVRGLPGLTTLTR